MVRRLSPLPGPPAKNAALYAEDLTPDEADEFTAVWDALGLIAIDQEPIAVAIPERDRRGPWITIAAAAAAWAGLLAIARIGSQLLKAARGTS